MAFLIFLVLLTLAVVVVLFLVVGNLCLKTADKVKRRDEEIVELYEKVDELRKELAYAADRFKKLAAFVRGRDDADGLQELTPSVPYNELRPKPAEQ